MGLGVMTPFRRVILSRRLISISYAPDDLDGDMPDLVHLGLRVMFHLGRMIDLIRLINIC